MNEDDILRMAREAGPLTKGPFDAWCQRFANLVAVHKAEVALAEAYRCGHEAGAVAEREACAEFFESTLPNALPNQSMLHYAELLAGIAAAIRARGNT